jgi:hypothetical protein
MSKGEKKANEMTTGDEFAHLSPLWILDIPCWVLDVEFQRITHVFRKEKEETERLS